MNKMNKMNPSDNKTSLDDEARKLVLVVIYMSIFVVILLGFGPLI